VELLQRTRTEHCEENQKSDAAALKRSSSNSSGVDTFGQILGVEKGTKLTDTSTKSIKQTYNPGFIQFIFFPSILLRGIDGRRIFQSDS